MKLFVILLICLAINSGKSQESNVAEEALSPADIFKNYDEVIINDPQPSSSGVYLRMSQKGIDYITALAADALPQLLVNLPLPNVQVESFQGKNFVITKLDKPNITSTFVEKTGVNFLVTIPYLEVEGDATIDMFFTANSHMLAVLKNWTITLNVEVKRALGADRNDLTVAKCEGHVGVALNFSGTDDSDILNSLSDTIGEEIEKAIKSNICKLPLLLNSFFEIQQQQILTKMEAVDTSLLTSPAPSRPASGNDYGFCSDFFGPAKIQEKAEEEEKAQEPLDEVSEQLKSMGTWKPDLTLTYPLTFSKKDVIFGIEGGAVLNGRKSQNDKVKLSNVTIMRDQMLGLILSEYVPNSILYHLYDSSLGYFEDSYDVRHLPKNLRPIAKIACAGCKLILKANMTERPHVTIDRNGLVLVLEGSLGVHFFRQNKTYEVLVADGVFRVVLKPQFRHSRIFSDIQLTGVDFKIYKVALNGMLAAPAQKVLNFIVPRTIWPKIQKSLRFAINRRGMQLPTICGVQFEKVHIDYIKHAAVVTTDFWFDLPHFLKAFKSFMLASN